MADTLIQNAGLVLTMDDTRRAVPSGDVLMHDGRIVAVGRHLPATGCTVVNAAGCLVTPGLVNTHHHLYQTMTRAVPAGQDAALFGWLQALYPIWAAMRPDDFLPPLRWGWQNFSCRAAQPLQITSISIPMARGWKIRYMPRKRSVCGFTPHGGL